MLQLVVILSFMITGIYTAFQQGNVLGWLRIFLANQMDKAIGIKWSRYVQKPLWDCLPCMASLWTIVLTWSVDPLLVIAVCGLNALFDTFIHLGDATID